MRGRWMFFRLWIFAAGCLTAGETVYFLPHFTFNNGDWDSVLSLYNGGAQTAELRVQVWDNDGRFRRQAVWSLAPGSGLFGPVNQLVPELDVAVGWLEIRSSSSDIKGILKFTALPTGGATSLQLDRRLSRELVFPLIENNAHWAGGFAVVNTTARTLSLALSLSDFDGQALWASELSLGPKAKLVNMLAQLVPGPLPERAILRMSADGELAGFALNFSTGVEQIVAVPAETLDVEVLQSGPAYEFVNGMWFDGQAFVPDTFYVQNGILTRTRPASIDGSYDLTGKFAVPPYGEAHTHTLANGDTRIPEFLNLGIFYAKVMNNFVSERDRLAPRFNKPDSVDIRSAVAGITASNGHPVQIGRDNNGLSLEAIDGDWLTLVDSRADLEAKWPSVPASGTDFVKTFLVNSHEYEERFGDPTVKDRYRGLDPALLPEIVTRAHGSGLRVACHVRTAFDFHNAILAGVDEIAHLPGFAMGPSDLNELEDPRLLAELEHPEWFTISDEDAAAAARLGVVVHTTIAGPTEVPPEIPEELVSLVRQIIDNAIAVHRANLQLLRNHGVTVVCGSDAGEGSVLEEIAYLDFLEIYPRPELLGMLWETTPRQIFPERKLGKLCEGFEASFLVLNGNPLENLDHLDDIALRFKQGLLLETP